MAHPFYVTTPIYYVNARPHIGHAYTTIVADVLARRHRLLADPTWFLTGTDEHGQKIERSATAAGIAPQQFADEVSASFSTLWKRMGITNDYFIRTTDEAHKRGVRKLFTDLYRNGKIYLSSYTGQYCVSDEMFVEGPPGTIGPDGKPTETVTEENFFFRLSEYQLPLLDLIESGELSITPEARKNEVLSFLRGTPESDASKSAAGKPYQPGALKDLSISRSSFTWGIPVPEEIQLRERVTKPHVIYVWLDALANYITALGYGSEDDSRFREFWPANVHLVGKEIIRFHCVYWPAFLMAAGLPLPKAVTAHGWLLFDDSKMSKSKGNIVRTETILEAFGQLCPPQASAAESTSVTEAAHSFAGDGTAEAVPLSKAPSAHDRDLFASDVLRYFLLREIPFGQDGSFTFDAFVTRYNADLANGYGNLVSRTLGLIAQNFEHGLKEPKLPWLCCDRNVFRENEGQPVGAEVWSGTHFIKSDILDLARFANENCWPDMKFRLLLAEVMQRVTFADGYISFHKPWKLAKSDVPADRDKLVEVLYTAAESIRIITALLYPIMPFATANVWRQLGLGDIHEAASHGELNNLQWGGLKPGTKLGLLSPVFPRADKGLVQMMSDMEEQKADSSKYTPQVIEQNDGSTSRNTEFVETPVSSEAGSPVRSKLVDETFAAPAPVEGFDPAAGPRTSAMPELNPGAQVAGSNASTTERTGTPSHTEAASGIFAAQPASDGPADQSPEITIDDFAKVELRVAKVIVCERIPKADKLLRLEVDLGYEQRQILSGIAEWYTPEELIGRRIVVITNLAPRKMRGFLSHGMLLAASADGGKPALATFADSDTLPLGSRLK